VNAVSTTTIVMRRCLVQTALPFGVTAGLAMIGAMANGIDADGATLTGGHHDPGAFGPWLQLPAFVAAAACCATAIETWPTLARDRRGVDWILRATNRPLHGCGAAIFGALLALAIWLLPLAVVAGLTSPAPHAYRVAAPADSPILGQDDPSITFVGPGTRCKELRLRPIAVAALRGAGQPTGIQVVADEPLLAEPLTFAGGLQLARIPIDDRVVTELVVQRQNGDLPLVFPPGSVELVESQRRSSLANAGLALGSYLVPAAVALALATLAAPFAALPTNLALVFAALLVQTLGKLGPTGVAMAQLGRGRWLPDDLFFQQCISSLGTGLVVMILAILVRWRITS